MDFHLPNFGTSSSGELLSLEMPLPGVFLLEYTYADPVYAVSPDYCGAELSPEALAYGQRVDGWRFFDSNSGQYIIAYEILRVRHKFAFSMEEKQLLAWQMANIALLWRDEYPDYFGESPAPRLTPAGPGARYRRAAAGLWFIEGGGEWFFSVSAPLCARLSQAANAMGTVYPLGGDITGMEARLYDRTACAVPIWELLDGYAANLTPFLTSAAALYTALRRDFPAYVARINQELQKTFDISGSEDVLLQTIPDGDSNCPDFLRLPK